MCCGYGHVCVSIRGSECVVDMGMLRMLWMDIVRSVLVERV